jgi:hypothetical protein
MRRTPKYFILLVFLFLTNLAFGQSGGVTGQIIDSTNEETLSGATISVSGTKIKAIADFDGNFKLNLSPGIYKIEISMISYAPKTETIEIRNEPKDLKIKLNQIDAVNSSNAETILVKQLVTQNPENKGA